MYYVYIYIHTYVGVHIHEQPFLLSGKGDAINMLCKTSSLQP